MTLLPLIEYIGQVQFEGLINIHDITVDQHANAISFHDHPIVDEMLSSDGIAETIPRIIRGDGLA